MVRKPLFDNRLISLLHKFSPCLNQPVSAWNTVGKPCLSPSVSRRSHSTNTELFMFNLFEHVMLSFLRFFHNWPLAHLHLTVSLASTEHLIFALFTLAFLSSANILVVLRIVPRTPYFIALSPSMTLSVPPTLRPCQRYTHRTFTMVPPRALAAILYQITS